MAEAAIGRRRQRPAQRLALRAVLAFVCVCWFCLPLVQSLHRSEAFLLCGRPASAAASEKLRRSRKISAAASPEFPTVPLGRMTTSPGVAPVKITRLKKGEKYRGAIDPKLRALVDAEEYRQVVDLMANLQDQGLLTPMLQRAEEYWLNLDYVKVAMTEKNQGGRAVVKALRKDWPKIWPEELEENRTSSFELFAAFWRRVDQSQVVDTLMDKVLPDEIEDGARINAMSNERREEEIARRLNTTDLSKQYRILAENDTAVAELAPQVLPLFAKGISMLNFQMAQLAGRVDLGSFANAAVAAAVALSFVLVLQIGGFVDIKLPSLFGDEIPELGRTAPTDFGSDLPAK